MNISLSPSTDRRSSYRHLLSWICCATLTLIAASNSMAFSPSAAQIAQFKAMSPEQQQAAAQAMGVDISNLQSVANGSGSAQALAPEGVSGKRSASAGEDKQGRALEQFSSDATENPSLAEDRAKASTNENLKLFGYDLFDHGAETFMPAADMPVPATYIMGPGDTVVIQLYGKENSTYSLNLDREGQIMFPNIGPVNLAGLAFSSAKDKINDIVSQQMIGVKSSVTMGALRTIRIFVLGEAQLPGSYVVGSLSTMTNAIFASGGITKIGSLRNIQLKRQGTVITTLDLYDLLLKGDTQHDARLLPGDVIFIPPIGKTVGVSGEVKRPAVYELTQETTVAQALKLAGGLMPTAYLPASRIERITASGEKTLVNLDLSSANGRNFTIKDADVVQIFATLDTMKDIVKLDGHVKRPGGFAWRENMRFTDIVASSDALLPDPDIEIGLIQRERKHTRKIELIAFSPRKAFNNPGSEFDPHLNPRDQVQLFNYTDNRAELLANIIAKLQVQANFDEQEKTITVHGAIRFEGTYPKTIGMTAKQAILLAGGLSENALETEAEITRQYINELRERTLVHTRYDLNIENPPLQEGDTLRIRKIALWDKKESVEIRGEVYHPGTYAILPGESLVDVLKRAGGLTPRAYPEGAIFSRQELRELEAERLQNLKQTIAKDIAATNIEQSTITGSIDKEEADVILDTVDQVAPLGRMVINLPTILKSPDTHDFQLIGGDVLDIPRFKPSVTVLGEVQYATSHFFEKSLKVKDYIARSGGTKNNADKKRIYVIKANGLVYTPGKKSLFKRDEKLSPGDTIIVPIQTKKVDALTLWSSVTTIMYQAALGVAAIASL